MAHRSALSRMGDDLRAYTAPTRRRGVTHTGASAEEHALASDDVSRAIREILDSRRNVDSSSSEVLHHVSVCGSRVTVHLALQVSGSAELEELDAIVASRLRALGASDVEVVIRRPEPSLVGRLRGRGDPWAGQVQLARVQHVVAVGAGRGASARARSPSTSLSR